MSKKRRKNSAKNANVRTALRDLGADSRHRFIGYVARFGTKNGYEGRVLPTVMLRDVRLAEDGLTGEILTDHLWFTKGKQFEDLNVREGDLISFDARVAGYWKGYMGYRDDVWDKPVEYDYKLERPTKFAKLDRETEEALAEARRRSSPAAPQTDDAKRIAAEVRAVKGLLAADERELDLAADEVRKLTKTLMAEANSWALPIQLSPKLLHECSVSSEPSAGTAEPVPKIENRDRAPAAPVAEAA